jgi:DNA-binding MarR family transcriptional regulator
VLRGYIDCAVDPTDRRKLTVTLTERGQGAAAAQNAARSKIDAALASKVGNDNIRGMRRALAALVELGRKDEAH